MVIKSEPTSEDDFLRSRHSSCADDDSDLPAAVAHNLATEAGQKRFLDESSHDEIVKSEFGQTVASARVVAPSGRTVLGTILKKIYFLDFFKKSASNYIFKI